MNKTNLDILFENGEQIALIRSVVTRRGRTFVYMRPYKFRLWDKSVDLERMKARIHNILYGKR